MNKLFTLNANSHFTRLQNNSSCSPLKEHTQMACVHRSKDTHHWHQLDLSKPISSFSWDFQVPLYMAVQTPATALFEDFQTVALDNDHWITDPVPDRHLCVHEHLQPHSLCCYPCPYSSDSALTSYHDMLDLSNISDFKDVMTTSSDNDIPALDDVFGFWNQLTMVCINIYITFK